MPQRITTRLPGDPLAVYRQLDHVSPVDRTEIVLQLIEEYGRLELPVQDGMQANLQNVDLSRETLKRRVAQLQIHNVPWWNPETQQGMFDGANLNGANLQDANLGDTRLWLADLQGANLSFADLGEARLYRANLQKANLWRANLQNARVYDANFAEADLRNARLHETDMSTCNLTHVYLGGSYFDRTRLRFDQFNGLIGEELLARMPQPERATIAKTLRLYRDKERSQEEFYRVARSAYLGLKQNFEDIGDYEGAAWAYRKERIMEKLETWHSHQYLEAVTDQLVEWTCDYGEGIGHVIASLIVLFALFVFGYGLFGAVVRADGTHLALPQDWLALATFSLNTMTNTDPGVLHSADDPLAHFAQAVQTLLTIFFTGLLGFVVGNRIRRS